MASKNYTLRDERGVMKARLPEAFVARLALDGHGEWRPYQAKGGPKTRAFCISTDLTWGTTVVLYLWKGDKIIEEVS
jgi:hypothetical protein